MSSALNKRQQARNERILQDLVKSIPGNDRCADCSTRNPAWASWSLGIFLCIRCASLHRKLGTHVTKVKSITMDSWSNEQVDNMRKNGNIKSNAYYNPDASNHPPPLDSEDTDSDLERYIRAKYEYQTFRKEVVATQQRATSSTSFGASTTTSSSPSLGTKPAKKKLGLSLFRGSSPSSKASQVLGGSPYTDSRTQKIQFPHGMVGASPIEKYGDQLQSLREMGFASTDQNLEILQQTNGNTLDAVEILVKLNRGTVEDKPLPQPPPKDATFGGAVQAQKTGPAAVGRSSNPFEALDQVEPAPPQVSAAQQQPLQPIHVHHTAASAPMVLSDQYPVQQQPAPWPPQSPSIFGGLGLNINGTGYPNPMMPAAPSTSPAPQNPFYVNAMSPMPTNNPYMMAQQAQQMAQPQPQAFYQPQMRSQMQPHMQPQPQFALNNPYQQQMFSAQPPRVDKNQILALYNAPQLAPIPPANKIEIPPSPAAAAPAPEPAIPSAGSNNPFLEKVQQTHVRGHGTQESVDFTGWQSGRHSPDAFASLAFGGR